MRKLKKHGSSSASRITAVRVVFAVLAFTLTLNLVPALQAQNFSAADRVEASLLRPRMADIIPAYETRGPEIESEARAALTPETRERLGTYLPAFIATMEVAYPDLVYVFLGRDAAFLGDAVDAYYLSRGEAGRVLRLDASRKTIPHWESHAFALLRESGFRPTVDGLDRPYIIFDRTDYETYFEFNDTSQLKRLLSAGFRGSHALGIKPTRLKRTFGGVSLLSKPGSVTLDVIRDHFKNWRLVRERRYSDDFFVLDTPNAILSIGVPGLIDRSEWHGSFGQLSVDDAGRFIAQPVTRDARQNQSNALELYGTWLFVSTPSFHASVEQEMRKLDPQLAETFMNRRRKPLQISSLLQSEPGRLSAKEKIDLLTLLEESKVPSELDMFKRIGDLVRDEGLRSVLAKMSLRLENHFSADGAPAIAAFLARYDILLAMKDDPISNQMDYERLARRTLLDLQKLILQTNMKRGPRHSLRDSQRRPTLISDQLATALQEALNVATSSARLAVNDDLAKLVRSLPAGSTRHVNRVSKQIFWKSFLDRNSDLAFSWSRSEMNNLNQSENLAIEELASLLPEQPSFARTAVRCVLSLVPKRSTTSKDRERDHRVSR